MTIDLTGGMDEGRGYFLDFALALQQAGLRYRWDGEETFGMMERSIPVELLER